MATIARIAALASISTVIAASTAHADKWTGVYIGAGGGFAMANHELDFSNGPALPSPAFNVNLDGLGGEGGLFTLGVGADYQVNRNIVVGAFFDYDWMNAETSIGASIGGFGGGLGASAEFEVENQWSIGGRIGYLASPRTLLFVSAGYTRVDVSDMTFAVSTGGPSFSGVLASTDTFSGYFIGGGAEIRLTEAISIKGEYRYTSLGSENVTLLPDLAPGINDFVTTTLDPSIQTARVSLNYRFGLGHSSSEPDASPPAGTELASGWTGFYIGAGGGFAMANHELDFSNGPLAPPPPSFNVNLDGLGGEGGLFTLGLGADYQVNRNILVGAFFDYDWMNADTSIGASIGGFGGGLAASAEFEVENQWSIGGRVGYLPNSRTLLFVSAGYTQVDVSDMTFAVTTGGPAFSGVLASSDTFSGYFIGGGAEIRLTDSISIKGEYRYTSLGSENVTLLPDLAPGINDFVTTTLDPSIQTARVVLTYRFHRDAPATEPLK